MTTQAAVPPHSIEAEQSVLGAILLSDRSIYGLVIEEGLRPDDFYVERHAEVFAAMLALYNQSEPVDVLTVVEQLKTAGRLEAIGGETAVHALAGPVPVAANVRKYGQIVKQRSLMRRLLRTSWEIQQSVFAPNADPRDLLDKAERAIFEVAHSDRKKDFQKIEDILQEQLKTLERLSREHTALTGTPSGFKDLDDLTGGFQPGNLIILAARPSMGKSALVANIAENAAIEHGRPVALFSLEMSESELAQRFIASQARVKGEDLRRGRVQESRWPKILTASQRIAAAPIFVDDSSDMGIMEVRAKARRLHAQLDAQGGLGLIIIDYLQLMRAEGGHDNRVHAVGEMSRGLKILARELEVPVIALSQLSRAVEQRTPKIPQLSDLRESGNIEQDADVVMFIYRDEYYNREESEHQGEADVIIAKHRNGPLGKATLSFLSEYPKFMTLAREDRFAA